MPKGFLVKRSKKAGPVSYRQRAENDSTPKFVPSPGGQVFSATTLPSVLVRRTPYFGGQPESFFPPSFSPTRPDSEGYANQYPSSDSKHQTSAGSPPQPELLLEPVLGGFALNGSPVSPSLPEMTTKVESACPPLAPKRPAISSNPKSNHSASKKRKTASPQERKLINRDAVTTSPVLGLRIKEDHEEDSKEVSSSNSSLGEFICQLCKQRYLDPLSLAHHKCSRIVRVEYRCTECDKTFSCPANLASHRRWHKPKGEENQPQASSAGSSATAQSEHSDSGSEEDAQFSCAQCGKKFRRQAYLRKHLALHERKAAGLRQDLNLGDQIEPINLVKQASPEGSSKFLMAMCATKSETFPCRFCGENFFSSPGLTRHINKHHPTESRQMILLTHAV
ncbi:insulinoma-associated protein 1a-like [Trichomycterus rosablanca]|uniref:insulinoma-associated protein 1a-like n=1 Tax=Trichomycterus rosablanca TaxID=2290929 RepID=UPI002F356EF8